MVYEVCIPSEDYCEKTHSDTKAFYLAYLWASQGKQVLLFNKQKDMRITYIIEHIESNVFETEICIEKMTQDKGFVDMGCTVKKEFVNLPLLAHYAFSKNL